MLRVFSVFLVCRMLNGERVSVEALLVEFANVLISSMRFQNNFKCMSFFKRNFKCVICFCI